MKNIRTLRSKWLFVIALSGTAFSQVPSDVKPALDRISPESLKADVSFLASDVLQGRATPSPGLEVAAEFIASQFRRAGLEPAGDDGYFQVAKLQQVEADLAGFVLQATDGTETVSVPAADVAVTNFSAVDLAGLEAVKADAPDRKGKAVFATLADLRKQGGLRELRKSGAALIIVAGFRPRFGPRLIAPEDRTDAVPAIFVRNEAIAKMALKPGAKLTVHIAPPKETPVALRNVAAIIRGSDPKLKDTCVLVTAHYDHIGVKPQGEGDRINNGANDDASGTASIVEIAAALQSLPRKPKRSIVFVAFFGEEEGGIGSTFYSRHPIIPLARTLGDINLEHMGRTDDPTGPKLNDATITGFDFSDVPGYFVRAGELTGIKVYKDEKRSDPFFSRSDNQMLADRGVPAHSMCVAFEFPDYHNVGDEWQKLDYENMAKVDRMVALGAWMMAESDKVPEWNRESAGAAPYIEAARKLHGTNTQPLAAQ